MTTTLLGIPWEMEGNGAPADVGESDDGGGDAGGSGAKSAVQKDTTNG